MSQKLKMCKKKDISQSRSIKESTPENIKLVIKQMEGDRNALIEMSNQRQKLSMTSNGINSINQLNSTIPSAVIHLPLETIETGQKKTSMNGPSTPKQSKIKESVNSQEELKNKLNQQSILIEDLNLKNKKLQIQILNSNQPYYLKQIDRLKAQLQKTQEENEDNKHLSFIARNQNNQLQANLKTKTEEIKNLLKNIEKEKIQNSQYKHLLSEKEKFINKITEEMGRSNQTLSQNYQELNIKYLKLENKHQQRIGEFDQLDHNYQVLQGKYSASEQQITQLKIHYEKAICQEKRNVSNLENRIRNQQHEPQQIIEKLEKELKDMANQRMSEDLLANKKIDESKVYRELHQLQQELNGKSEQIKEQNIKILNKENIIQELESQLMNFYSPEQYSKLEQAYQQLQFKRINESKQYNHTILNLTKENQSLSFEKLNKSEKQKQLIFNSNNGSFQDFINTQIKQIEGLKQEIISKNEKLYKLKEELQAQQLINKSLSNDIEIVSKKSQSAVKNLKIQNDIELQNFKNEVDSLKRKLETNESKLKYKIRENQEKQTFITNTIIGSGKKQDASLMMAELERIFMSKVN